MDEPLADALCKASHQGHGHPREGERLLLGTWFETQCPDWEAGMHVDIA